MFCDKNAIMWPTSQANELTTYEHLVIYSMTFLKRKMAAQMGF